MEHRVDRVGELTAIPFIYAASVDPKVMQLVLSRLTGTEFDLSKAIPAFVAVEDQIFEGDFIGAPSVGENCIWRNRFSTKIDLN
jgi:hypothetical protein